MRFWFSLSLFVFSVAYFIYGLNTLSFYTSSGRPGPGYFPVLVAVGLIISTGINLAKDISAIRKLRASFFSVSVLSGPAGVSNELVASVDGEADEEPQPHHPKDVLTVVALVTALIVMLTLLGGLLSMVVFMLGLLSIMNRGQWVKNIIYSLLLPMFLYLLFDVWLNASLPIGIFGI